MSSIVAENGIRLTPSLQEVQRLYGKIKVKPYDQQFLLKVPVRSCAWDTLRKLAIAAETVLSDSEIGINWFSTQLVAEAAGVSVGIVYRYFEDKIALLDYVWPERRDTVLKRGTRL
jgi:hypothetical protein